MEHPLKHTSAIFFLIIFCLISATQQLNAMEVEKTEQTSSQNVFDQLPAELVSKILMYVVYRSIHDILFIDEAMKAFAPFLRINKRFSKILTEEPEIFNFLVAEFKTKCRHTGMKQLVEMKLHRDCQKDEEHVLYITAAINSERAAKWLVNYSKDRPKLQQMINEYAWQAWLPYLFKFLVHFLNIPFNQHNDKAENLNKLGFTRYRLEPHDAKIIKQIFYMGDFYTIDGKKYTTLKTPLMSRCEENSFDSVQALIDVHADVNAKDRLGFTPLMYACRYKSPAEGHGFVPAGWGEPAEKKPKFDARAETVQKQIEIIKMLLASGADMHAKNDLGQTIFDQARPEVCEYLRNYEHGHTEQK